MHCNSIECWLYHLLCRRMLYFTTIGNWFEPRWTISPPQSLIWCKVWTVIMIKTKSSKPCFETARRWTQDHPEFTVATTNYLYFESLDPSDTTPFSRCLYHGFAPLPSSLHLRLRRRPLSRSQGLQDILAGVPYRFVLACTRNFSWLHNRTTKALNALDRHNKMKASVL